MQFKTINDRLSTSGQIQLSELGEVAKAGFKSIICNRPDDEGSDQPTFAELAASAKKVGLESRYIPVVSGKVTDNDAVLFETAMAELPGPVLAFCRTGARSAMMWEMSQRLIGSGSKAKGGQL
jgi:sulfide:quinone oxidoreductase